MAAHILSEPTPTAPMTATNTLAARSRRPLGKSFAAALAAELAAGTGSADARFTVTFNTVWMSGWAPSADQPKPLKPGSAKVSLADVLGRAGR